MVYLYILLQFTQSYRRRRVEKVDFHSLAKMVILKIRSMLARSNQLFIMPQLNIDNI